jgi:CRISPR-associated endonuclease/helicase Cas3
MIPSSSSGRALLICDFWGKANSNQKGGSGSHSIAYHSLDVGAVGAQLIEHDRERLGRIAESIGISVNTLTSVLPFLFAIHDIGKYARVFQAKAPGHWPTNVLDPYREIAPGNNHVITGFQMLVAFSDAGPVQEIFESVMPGWSASERKILFRALAGHHGRPPDEAARSSFGQHDVCTVCVAAAQTHIHAMFALMRPAALPRRSRSELTILGVGLAGLFVLADWIGSAETWFPYTDPIEEDYTFERYWRLAREAAKRAIDEAGVLPSKTSSFAGVSQLFSSIKRLSPVQAFAQSTELPAGPALIIIEDVTGAGKTEAALIIAHRMMSASRANGLYFALPTEATANAMYTRLGGSFRRLFAKDASPSLVLAHGRRALHEGFRNSVVDRAAREEAKDLVGGDDQVRPSSAECAEWIADDRRKAFLADVGAGTIDQALFAILPVRHQSLRLWGLADRILIVDEAHAYDAYMERELETLLEFHAALGGSSIILSATLPKRTRHKLARAFSAGVEPNRTEAIDLQATQYPLVTIVEPDNVVEAPQPIREGLTRFVTATRVGDLDSAITRVVTAARTGASVSFVRNTVDGAIEAWDRLRDMGLDPLLFHARFAMCDRQQIEAEVMRRFGPNRVGNGKGTVLVATQVIEQSLDIDFDLMVTDLAPIDLIIQRAGRLWRHDRGPRPIAGPELVVLSGEPVDAPDKDWATRVLGGGARVYPDHALLWRSARALFQAGGIAAPAGIRKLVETVYDEDLRDPAPEAILPRELRAAGKTAAAAAIAQTNVLLLRPQGGRQHVGYSAGAGLWDSDVRVPTRLSADSVRIRLGRLAEDTVYSWAEADEPWRAWALSEVPVRVGRIAREDESDPKIVAATKNTKSRWPIMERVVPLIALQLQNNVWRGFATNGAGQSVQLKYSFDRGLTFE